jgi:hypothetical protein
MAYVGYLSRKSSQEIDKFTKKVILWLPLQQKSVLKVVCNENQGGVVEKMAYVGYLTRKSSQEIDKFPKKVKLWIPVQQKRVLSQAPFIAKKYRILSRN